MSEFEKDNNLDRYINEIQMQILKVNSIINGINSPGLLNMIKHLISNDYFGTFLHFKAEMLNSYICNEFNIKSKEFTNISGLIIKDKINNNKNEMNSNNLLNKEDDDIVILDESNKSKINSRNNNSNRENKLVIICSGNGAPFEIFHKNNYWINFYLNNSCHVCLWNYRSYGESTGSPNFDNMKSDSESILMYVNSLGYKKIITHGISLGGVPACYLAK